MKFQIFLVLCAALMLSSCGKMDEGEMVAKLPEAVAKGTQSAEQIPEGLEEIFDGVLDDGSHMAFIFCRAKDYDSDNLDGADFSRLSILLSRKLAWHVRFPEKKVVAMAIFTERIGGGDSTHSVPLGLLIEYEKK